MSDKFATEAINNVVRTVREFTGPIQPTGDPLVDTERMDNLKAFFDILDDLIEDAWVVKGYADNIRLRPSQQNSMRPASEFAKNWFKELSR